MGHVEPIGEPIVELIPVPVVEPIPAVGILDHVFLAPSSSSSLLPTEDFLFLYTLSSNTVFWITHMHLQDKGLI